MINSRERRWRERGECGCVVLWLTRIPSLWETTRLLLISCHRGRSLWPAGAYFSQASVWDVHGRVLGFQLMSGARQTLGRASFGQQPTRTAKWRASPSKITNSSACGGRGNSNEGGNHHARRARPRTRSIGKNSARRASRSRQVRLGKTGAWRITGNAGGGGGSGYICSIGQQRQEKCSRYLAADTGEGHSRSNPPGQAWQP